MVWIKFHDSLCSGYWKGIPRGVRFVLMELSLLARAGDGQIELPFGTADPIEGLVELLGGNRREARLAIRQLEELGSISFESESQDHATGSKPKPDIIGVDPVVYRASAGKVACVIPSWTRWQSIDRSASRVRKHRAKGEQYQAPEPPCNALHDVTVTACNALHDVTVTACNGDVTLLDKRREDKKRISPHPLTPVEPVRGPLDLGESDTSHHQDQVDITAADRATTGVTIRPQLDCPEPPRVTPPPRNGSPTHLAATETRLEPLPLPQGAPAPKDASGGKLEAAQPELWTSDQSASGSPDPAPSKASKGRSDPAGDLFAHFLARREASLGGSHAPKLTAQTCSKIRSRLRVFSPQQLREAIEVLFAPGSWWVENKFTSPAYVFRSDDQVEKLLARVQPQSALPPPPPSAPPPLHPSLVRYLAEAEPSSDLLDLDAELREVTAKLSCCALDSEVA
jgi:hypothetical protein